ncbi:MAG: glycosyltransferase family 2 protein [Burkholderiales bacterium]|nr:glycosyltransferase family 2 protein [Burkholderiales bacterium]
MLNKLSLVIISQNEEAALEQCLQSCVSLVDEIVIIDSGSTDGTQAIALKYKAHFIHQDWLGFGAQKNYAVTLAKHDWVLCLDADEYLTTELAIEISQELDNPRAKAYQLIRCNKFLGKFLRHGAGYPDCSIRLFNRQAANWSNDLVHEKVEVVSDCAVATLKHDYLHNSGEDFMKYLHKQDRYTTTQALRMLELNKSVKLSKLFFSPFIHFIKYYVIKRGFMDGVPGFIHIVLGSINSFQKYAKLYALCQQKSQ